MIANTLEISKSFKTNEIEIRLKVIDNHSNLQELTKALEIIEKGKMLDVGLKQYRKKRSLDANAYCWILAQKIAETIGNTKEFVYKETIKRVGQFEIVPIKDNSVETWIKNWESKGIGWQSIILDKSKLDGYTNTINYYGSSTYDSRDMYLLLEEIVGQAKELGINTITDKEKEALIDKWENKGV